MSDSSTTEKHTKGAFALAMQTKDNEIERLKAKLHESESQLKETKAKLKFADTRFAFVEEVTKAGLLPEAIHDMVTRAESFGEWITDPGGKLYLKNEKGSYGKSAEEWLRDQKAKTPTYFADHALTEDPHASGYGYGSGGNGSGVVGHSAGQETDPEILADFHPDTMNLTTVSVMYNKEPERAKRIAKQVGNPIFKRIEEQDRRFGR